MILKKHKANNKTIIAICDPELIGKKIETEKLILNLDSEFYKGENATNEEILKAIRFSSSIVAVGEKTINFLIKNKINDEKNVKKINGVPYINIIFV